MAKRPLKDSHVEVLHLHNGFAVLYIRKPGSRVLFVYERIFHPRHLIKALKVRAAVKRHQRFDPDHWKRCASATEFRNRLTEAFGESQ